MTSIEGVRHYKNYVDGHDTLFEYMQTIPWETVKWGATGRALPRKIYRSEYPSDELMDPFHDVIAKIQQQDNVVIDGIWCNMYRDGKDNTPYHQDNYGCNVYCICLGATRAVNFKETASGKVTKLLTKSGDMYVFTPEVDRAYRHAVPKTTAQDCKDNVRISVVMFGTPSTERIEHRAPSTERIEK